jgi:hypothetical protein
VKVEGRAIKGWLGGYDARCSVTLPCGHVGFGFKINP